MNGKVKIRLVDTFVKHSTENPEMTFVYRVPCLSSLSSLWSHLALRHLAIFGDHRRRYRFILGARKRQLLK